MYTFFVNHYINQPKYELLRQVIKHIPEIHYHEFSEKDEVIDPSQARENSIIIFDDVMTDKQDKIRDYFCMGRHKLVDSIFLCQSYSKIGKHLIRDNCNVVIICKQDERNLKHIYHDHVMTDMSFEQFKQICMYCWKEKYGILVVMKDEEIDNGRYRFGFDRIFTNFHS